VRHGRSARLARRNVARALSATFWGMGKNGSAYRPEGVGVAAAAQPGDWGVSARTMADERAERRPFATHGPAGRMAPHAPTPCTPCPYALHARCGPRRSRAHRA